MENVTVKETLLGMDDSAEVRILNILKWFTTDVNLDLHNSMGWKLTKKQLFVEESHVGSIFPLTHAYAATIPREKPLKWAGSAGMFVLLSRGVNCWFWYLVRCSRGNANFIFHTGIVKGFPWRNRGRNQLERIKTFLPYALEKNQEQAHNKSFYSKFPKRRFECGWKRLYFSVNYPTMYWLVYKFMISKN